MTITIDTNPNTFTYRVEGRKPVQYPSPYGETREEYKRRVDEAVKARDGETISEYLEKKS